MKYKKGLVSVIIPAYNAEKYIEQAVREVLAQTYKKWELIVVDDGSTDSTARKVGAFNDKRITLMAFEKNKGAGTALHTGTRAAKGEFVSFLAADDFYHPGMLYESVRVLAGNPNVGLTYTDVGVLDSRGMVNVYHSYNYLPDEMPMRLLTDNYINSTTIVFRHLLYDLVGGYDFSLRYDIDGNFLYRISQVTRFQHIPIPLAVYRKHNTNLSKNKGAMRKAIDKNRLMAITELFTEQDIFHSEDKRKCGFGWLDMAGRWASTGSYAPALEAIRRSRKYMRLYFRGKLWVWKVRLLYLIQKIRYAFSQ